MRDDWDVLWDVARNSLAPHPHAAGHWRWLADADARPWPFEAAVARLRNHLYGVGYRRPTAAASASEPGRARPADADPALVAGFRAASAGYRTWEPGWHVLLRGADHAFVHDGALTLFVRSLVELLPPGAAVGEPVALRLPCAREQLVPGFFTVVGPAGPGAPLVRCYMHLEPLEAPRILAGLLEALADVPFQAKFANLSAGYERADPAVLYVEPAHYARAKAALLGLVARHPSAWRAGEPMFTRVLARGLAAAESPAADGESFGLFCCRLAAESALEAIAAGGATATVEGYQAALVRRLGAVGLAIEAPYARQLPAGFF